jgi:hypothetical protein
MVDSAFSHQYFGVMLNMIVDERRDKEVTMIIARMLSQF